MQVLVPLQGSLQIMETYLSHCTVEGKARLMVVSFRDCAVDDLLSTLVFD